MTLSRASSIISDNDSDYEPRFKDLRRPGTGSTVVSTISLLEDHGSGICSFTGRGPMAVGDLLGGTAAAPSQAPPPTTCPAPEPPPPEHQQSIDDETEVPDGLFNDLLKAGKEARARGQHVLVNRSRVQGSPRLVHQDLVDREPKPPATFQLRLPSKQDRSRRKE